MNFYCDISAVGTAGEYQAYAAVPTIGALATDRPRPMDGNGKTQNAVAASVAIAELQITTLPTDGQTLSIGGSAAITAKTTVAAKNQFAIGASIATATTNLTALINTFGTTNNTCDVAAVAAVSQALLAIPYLYYARVKPGTTDTIQLFTRVAGADFNTSNNTTSKVTQTGTWLNGGVASINFSEGVDGPFGYFASPVAAFGKVAGAYGIFPQKSSGSIDPTGTDVIVVRASRDAADLVCTVTNSGTTTSAVAAAIFTDRNIVIDNIGEFWAGDAGQFVLIIEQTGTGTVGFGNSAGGRTIIDATVKDGFYVLFKPSASYNQCSYGAGKGDLTLHRCKLDVSPLTAYANPYIPFVNDLRISFINCRLMLRKQQTLGTINGSYNNYVKFIGGTVEYEGIGSNITALFSAVASPGSPFELLLDSLTVKVDGGVGGFGVGAVVSGGNNINTGHLVTISVIDCVGFNNPSLGLPAGQTYPSGATFVWQDSNTGTFRREKMCFTTEFAPNSVYPTLDITDRAGSPMSCRVSWEAARLNYHWNIEAARFSTQYRGSNAINTCELELITPASMIPKESQIAIYITYKSPDGVLRNEDTIVSRIKGIIGSAQNLPVGIGLDQWTLNGISGVESRKLSVRTEHPIKQGSIVSAKFLLTGPPESGVHSIYISPNIRFTP